MKSFSLFKMAKNCNSKQIQNLILNSIRIRKLFEGKINFKEFQRSIKNKKNIQLKKETLKIGPLEFIVDKDNLKRKAACSIQPNKTYFIDESETLHLDLRMVNWR